MDGVGDVTGLQTLDAVEARGIRVARLLVADVVRDGGMPPLMIEPIDFMALYQARIAQAGGLAADQPMAGSA